MFNKPDEEVKCRNQARRAQRIVAWLRYCAGIGEKWLAVGAGRISLQISQGSNASETQTERVEHATFAAPPTISQDSHLHDLIQEEVVKDLSIIMS